MNTDISQILAVGQKIEGFLVTRITELPELRSIAYELKHQKTGARLLHLHNGDAENLFSVVFQLPQLTTRVFRTSLSIVF